MERQEDMAYLKCSRINLQVSFTKCVVIFIKILFCMKLYWEQDTKIHHNLYVRLMPSILRKKKCTCYQIQQKIILHSLDDFNSLPSLRGYQIKTLLGITTLALLFSWLTTGFCAGSIFIFSFAGFISAHFSSFLYFLRIAFRCESFKRCT